MNNKLQHIDNSSSNDDEKNNVLSIPTDEKIKL